MLTCRRSSLCSGLCRHQTGLPLGANKIRLNQLTEREKRRQAGRTGEVPTFVFRFFGALHVVLFGRRAVAGLRLHFQLQLGDAQAGVAGVSAGVSVHNI